MTKALPPGELLRRKRARFFARLMIVPAPEGPDRLGRPLVGPCLVWTGPKMNMGYGTVGFTKNGTKRVGLVHRVMYRLFIGPIVEQLDHLCRVRLCASPAHLEDVSQAENVRRGDAVGARTVKKTHCSNGHEFVEGSFRMAMVAGYNVRICIPCKKQQWNKWYQGPGGTARNERRQQARRAAKSGA